MIGINHRKYYIAALVLFVLLIVSALILNATKKEYGNNEESILRVIKSIDGYNSEEIEILEVKDIKNERVVPFLINNHPGYIQFVRSKRGNYEWEHIERRENESLTSFLVNLQGKELPHLMFLFVTNNDNEIAKVEVDVNGKVFTKELEVHESSVAWIDLPKHKSAEYKYRYFDKNGNLIDE